MKRFICLLIAICMLFSSNVAYAKESDDYKTFSQLDERWRYHAVHNSNYNLGTAGCFITSIAVIMGYANPELRDVDKFNPAVLADKMDLVNGSLYSNTCYKADSTFTKVLDDDGSFSAEVAKEKVLHYMKEGYYVVIMTSGQPITSSTHFSPIVGIEDGKPVVWDVAGGAHSDWDTWANAGISQIDVFQSSLNPSTKTMTGDNNVSASVPSTEEEKRELQLICNEFDLVGMTDASRLVGDQAQIELYDASSLSIKDQKNVQDIKEASSYRGKSFGELLSSGLFFIGLLLMMYSVALIMVTLFDYSNNFIDVSLLGILTFGRCRLVSSDTEIPIGGKNKRTYVTVGKMMFRVMAIIVVSVVIMSGKLQYCLMLLLNKILF